MPNNSSQIASRQIIAVIILALAAWAIYIAVGAYRYNNNPWRPVVVLVSMGLFLGFWLLMLWSQQRKKR